MTAGPLLFVTGSSRQGTMAMLPAESNGLTSGLAKNAASKLVRGS